MVLTCSSLNPIKMKSFLLIFLIIFFGVTASAQPKDSAKLPKRSFESLFAVDDTLTRNDYLLSIEKVFQALNKTNILSQPVPAIIAMNKRMNEDDSAINIIKERLIANDRAINIRNLQMYKILLTQINTDTKYFSAELKKHDSVLDAIKKQIFDLRKDTVVQHIFKDSILRASFRPQLQQLRSKWRKADSIVKYVNVLIDNSLARTSDNSISTEELLLQADALATTTGSRAFTKERRYLWESRPAIAAPSFSGQFQETIASEKKITQYYFSHTHNKFLLLLLVGLVFFFWVFYNYRSIKKADKLSSIESFHFHYINAIPIFASLVFMLNLAPLFDLDAPFVYIEFIQFLLMITLTVSFRKRLPKNLFHLWAIFIILFLLQAFSKYLGLPFYLNRWLLLILNCVSFLLGLYALWKYKKQYNTHKMLIITAYLYTLFNFLAVVCNLFGRVTLMQIFSSTGTYAFIQTAALIVFLTAVTEAFLLQIQASRIRKEYPENFEHHEIGKGISRLVFIASVIIWLIVFATNLNLYNFFSDKIAVLLSTQRSVGNFSFTFGGVILFLAIMWAANFLQKYIAYFFGDVGDDAAFNNKGQRSRFMITRLVLLVAGFLLAVAASGLAIDRITVILGALSVGIGLGLQSIVNNFVSGIILIFDRTLRIGDTVEIGDKKGRVKEISMRSSTLLTAEGAEVIIPNGDILSHNFVNWSLSNNYKRVDLSFTVDKMIFSEEVRSEISEIIKSSSDVLAQKDPEVFINSITSESAQIKLYFWCNDVTNAERARSEVYAAVYKYLLEKQIKIK